MPVLSCSLSSVAQAQQSAKKRWKSCCTALLSQPWTALPALTYGLPISFVESLFLLKGNHGQLIHHKASRMFEACLAHKLSHRPLENRRPTKQLSSAALPGKDTPNRILLNWNNPLNMEFPEIITTTTFMRVTWHQDHPNRMTGNFQCLQIPSVRAGYGSELIFPIPVWRMCLSNYWDVHSCISCPYVQMSISVKRCMCARWWWTQIALHVCMCVCLPWKLPQIMT